MSNNQNSIDDVQLDQLLAQAHKAQHEAGTPTGDERLKTRILASLPGDTVSIGTAPTNSAPITTPWLDTLWQWFAQPLRLAAVAALPLAVGFALGNATLITDNELLIALSEQDSWPLEQMLDEPAWSDVYE